MKYFFQKGCIIPDSTLKLLFFRGLQKVKKEHNFVLLLK